MQSVLFGSNLQKAFLDPLALTFKELAILWECDTKRKRAAWKLWYKGSKKDNSTTVWRKSYRARWDCDTMTTFAHQRKRQMIDTCGTNRDHIAQVLPESVLQHAQYRHTAKAVQWGRRRCKKLCFDKNRLIRYLRVANFLDHNKSNSRLWKLFNGVPKIVLLRINPSTNLHGVAFPGIH